MIAKYLSTNFFILPVNFQDIGRETQRSSSPKNDLFKESEIFMAKNIGSVALTSVTRGVFDIFFDYLQDSSEKRIKKNMKHLLGLGTAHASEYLSSFLSYQIVQKLFFRRVPSNIDTSFLSSNFIDQNYNFIQKVAVFVGSGAIYTFLNIPFYIFEISPYVDFTKNQNTDNYTPMEIIKTIGKTFAVNFFFTLGYGAAIALIAPKARNILTGHVKSGNKVSLLRSFIFSGIVERIATIVGSITAAPIRIHFSSNTSKLNAQSILGQVRYLTPKDFY